MPQFSMALSDANYIAWRSSINAFGLATAEPSSVTAFRPKEWSEGSGMLFYMQDADGNQYFFDGVLKTEHVRTRRITAHPVQSGTNITDHSFKIPSTLTMEIGVSDVMDCFAEDWKGGNSSRSINAYQGLKKIQDSGQPLTVTTRLDICKNMIIESVSAPEDYRTRNELRSSIRFVEISIASGANIKTVSKDEYVSQENPTGQVGSVSEEIEGFDSLNKTNLRKLLSNFGGKSR
jgi:hypothetical protein